MNDGVVPAGGCKKQVALPPVLLLANAPLVCHTKTLHLKIRPEAWAWLDQAAREVNQVWNYCNEITYRAWHGRYGRTRKWMSAYDLHSLLAGCATPAIPEPGDLTHDENGRPIQTCFQRIGIDVAQCVAGEHATRRNQFKKSKLRWRKSAGSNRSLGWIPFKGPNLGFREQLAAGVTQPPRPKKPSKPRPGKKDTKESFAARLEQHEKALVEHGRAVEAWKQRMAALPHRRAICFMGKSLRLFQVDRLFEARSAAGKVRSGNFAQNALGEWFLNVVVDAYTVQLPALKGEYSSIGLDPGCHAAMTGSEGETLATRFYREAEARIAELQRHGHKRQAKRVHQDVKNARQEARNQFARQMVDHHQFVFIGNADSRRLSKTRMAKSVLDAAWGACKTVLHERGHRAGRTVLVVDERNTTRGCSSCGALSGPTGLDGLVVRQWTCLACGQVHIRDENSARLIEQSGWQLAASLANARGVSLFSSCPLSRPGMGVR